MTGSDSKQFSFQHFKAPVRATWLWEASVLADQPTETLKFLKRKNINRLHLQINPSVTSAVYGDFIEAARRLHINVYALDGSPEWLAEDGKRHLEQLTEWLRHYQGTQSPEQQFSGIHLDVEPYLHADWPRRQASVVERYQSLLLQARHNAASLRLSLEADLPFWFEEIFYDNRHGSGNLAEWAVQQCDSITIMAYRDTAASIIEIVNAEITYGIKYEKPVVIGVETMKSAEGDYVSFYEEGEIYMYGQLEQIDSHFAKSGGYGGLAVHHFESWKILSS